MFRVRKTNLVCHGSLNPEVQYVYHCTTHVPYNTAYTKPFSTKQHRRHRGKKLTFTTTANTMGPKIMFTSISMLLKFLDNKSRRLRERGVLASGDGGAGKETARRRGRRE